MTHCENIFERVLRICAIDNIDDYLGIGDMSVGLLLCNKNINEIVMNKLLKYVEYSLTGICCWNRHLAKVRRIHVDTPSIHFFAQVFPKLEQITFGQEFNYPIIENTLPSTLKIIVFRWNCKFDLKIPVNALPHSLTKLEFGDYFDQLIEKNVLPCGLTKLRFGSDFNHPINKDVLPCGLTKLRFGNYFNRPVKKNVLPCGLMKLRFGNDFNQLIEKDVLPNNLTCLSFGEMFDQSITKGTLPDSLIELNFGSRYNRSITDILPCNLQTLTLGSFDSITIFTFPNTLNTLRIYDTAYYDFFENILSIYGDTWDEFFKNVERTVSDDYVEYTKKLTSDTMVRTR